MKTDTTPWLTRNIFVIALPLLQACGGSSESTSACVADTDSATFAVSTQSSDTLLMNGIIDCTTEGKLLEALDTGSINTLVMQRVLGSADDVANIAMSRNLASQNLAMAVADNGVIASGGVDFFLAGASRTVGNGSIVAVHSWADSDGAEGIEVYEQNPASENHQLYIGYYSQFVTGLSDGRPDNTLDDVATDFYVYTLEAAPADGLHCMTAQELIDWGIVTNTSVTADVNPTVQGDGSELSADYCTH